MVAIQLLSHVCQETTIDLSQYMDKLIRGLLKLLTDTNTEILSAAWAGVAAIFTKAPADDRVNTLRTV